jgi:hypothetical protein
MSQETRLAQEIGYTARVRPDVSFSVSIPLSMLHLIVSALLSTALPAPPDNAPTAPDLVSAPILVQAADVHRFWDWQNNALFAGVAASRAFDFFSTRKFREKHLKEWLLDDKTVDNRPLFAAIEIAGTAVSVAASYALHRTGYHRLERWASILHITFATAGGIWNCTLPNGL